MIGSATEGLQQAKNCWENHTFSKQVEAYSSTKAANSDSPVPNSMNYRSQYKLLDQNKKNVIFSGPWKDV